MKPFAQDSLYTDVYVAPALLYLQGLLRKAFGDVDPYHGIVHALAVEKHIFDLCEQPDLHVSNIEKLVLRAAALLHDIGYAAYEPSWSNDRREHVQAGLDLVLSQVHNAPIFSENPELELYVSYLIAYHDSTKYEYPSLAQGGTARPVELGDHRERLTKFEQSLAPEQQKRLKWLLDILREADARTGTDEDGADRTFKYSTSRGIPVFATGQPLNAWAWEESAVGNVRIAAKCAVRDTISAEGKRQAREYFDEAESYIKEICRQHNVTYTPEPWVERTGESSDFEIARYQNWSALEAALRGVSVLGDENAKPYASAKIQPKRMKIADLRPTAYYALHSQLEGHRQMYKALRYHYLLDLFELTGILDYRHEGGLFRMAPPIIETYHEASEDATVSAVVDGLHRVLLARELGMDSLWVVEISDVPEKMPLVPLPLRWEDVQLYDTVPPTHAKRKFRFPTIKDFPNVTAWSDTVVTESNFLYFFYRDLAALGSDGVRAAATP